MIRLVKHFLRRTRPKIALVLILIAVAWIFGSRHFVSPEIQWMWFMAGGWGIVATIVVVDAEEFDLVLPVRRRTLYLARNVASLLLMAVVAVPLAAAVITVGALEGRLAEAMRSCAAFAVFWTTLLLMTSPLLRLVRRMRLTPPAVIAGSAAVISVFFTMLLKEGIPNLLWLVVAVPVVAVAWYLDVRQFERYDLAPIRDAESAKAMAAGSRLMKRLSPMIRVLVRALWLKWWYLPMVVYMAGMGFIGTTGKGWTFNWMYWAIGMCIFMVFSRIGQELLPFIPRRTILRSVLGPFAAAPLLIGGVLAIATGSVQMIVRGLAVALAIVVVTWLMLPSAKEYRRSFLVHLRSIIVVILCLCIWVCAIVPSVRDFIQSAVSTKESRVAPWVAGNPFLVSCVIALVIALLWWRCERKFRHFEPRAFPTGLARTA